MTALSKAKIDCFALIMTAVMSSSEHTDLLELYVRRALSISRRLIPLRVQAEEPQGRAARQNPGQGSKPKTTPVVRGADHNSS